MIAKTLLFLLIITVVTITGCNEPKDYEIEDGNPTPRELTIRNNY